MSNFKAALASENVYPLWERETRHNRPPESPYVWRWPVMSRFLDDAIKAVNMTDAERRVLVLRNPNFANSQRDGAAINLSVNLQVLMPGEKARPHRHSMNALRFVLEGEGASTIVEGKDCPLLPGDMILTPAWTWHEHKHEGSKRAVWADALDVPVHTYFETGVLEPGPVHDLAAPPPDAAFMAAGLTPVATGPATPHSPMFRYAWDRSAGALQSLPAAKDGSRRLRYTNPVNGGAIMATLDCYLLGLTKGQQTAEYRTNSNCVSIVVEGEGETRVGDDKISWGPKDIFTLPHNQWISHKASANARVFQITDREMLQRLDVLRDEFRA